MVICHCLAVNDRAIGELAKGGPVSVDDVVAQCGAGGRCGGCRPAIEAVLAKVDVTTSVRVLSDA